MPRHSPCAIANEFLRRRGSPTYPSQMYIQKLVAIANGWNLAINGEPLVSEAPQAWVNGPVFRQIWDFVKEGGFKGPNSEIVDPITGQIITSKISGNEEEILDHVWKKYRNYTPQQLSDLTHQANSPWAYAYFEKGKNAEIDTERTRQYYIKLALAGRSNAEQEQTLQTAGRINAA
ncbi:Panacea domain-containing protein [Pseudovibrio brasiliensis]|nr:Panacea domain-containing protein [Pseudovibrio brasiliensis]